MAKHLRDHWYIAIALIGIFLAGNGSGYVFGSKTSRPAAPQQQVAADDWAGKTLEKLAGSLDLSAEQLAAIRPQVTETADKVVAARERTLLDYHVLLLNLHDDLEADLTPEQQSKWRESRQSLENTIKTRFSALLDPENLEKL